MHIIPKPLSILTLLLAICHFAHPDHTDNNIEKFIAPNNECELPAKLIKEIQSYKSVVQQILDNVLGTNETWQELAAFTDKIGNRITGSLNFENAVDYMLERLNASGLENVHTEPAKVPVWQRGVELAEILEPFRRMLPILGFGSTVGTPAEGIEAYVIAVESFEEFDLLKDEDVAGKIVVFAEKWESYGKTVQYRSRGASVAAKKGARAALVRSVTPYSIHSLHTGGQTYVDRMRAIPVAAITVEDAELILRQYRNGTQLRIKMFMDDRNLEAKMSRNTIAEYQGSLEGVEKDSIVVVAGHLDSWDVGVGAMDDGGGAFISWKALHALKKLGLRPKRTMRAILWVGEEQGYIGAKAYAKNHIGKDDFNFFLESDTGTFDPLGLDFTGSTDAGCILQEVLKLLEPLNATQFTTPMDGGSDIELFTAQGYPGASLLNKNERYFWFHHSDGDSMLLEDPNSLDKCTAVFAVVSYVIADLSIEMPKNLVMPFH